jgi:hypothetical protein
MIILHIGKSVFEEDALLFADEGHSRHIRHKVSVTFTVPVAKIQMYYSVHGMKLPLGFFGVGNGALWALTGEQRCHVCRK